MVPVRLCVVDPLQKPIADSKVILKNRRICFACSVRLGIGQLISIWSDLQLEHGYLWGKDAEMETGFPKFGVPLWRSLHKGLPSFGVYIGVRPFRESAICMLHPVNCFGLSRALHTNFLGSPFVELV